MHLCAVPVRLPPTWLPLRGVFDGTFEFELKLWDVAAGTLLVEEAGGKVEWFNFSNKTWEVDILATVPQFFEKIKEKISPKIS